jgi:DNA-binding XRE family transcriptional regulator
MSPATAIKPSARPISESAERFRESLHRIMQAADPPYSQASLARAIKEHQRTLGRILNGESTPTLDMAHTIAVALGTTLWDMLKPDGVTVGVLGATGARNTRTPETAS